MRVLLVEDDHSLRLLMRYVLRDHGFDVLEAETADAAKLLFDVPGDVDLLFTDVRMPGQLDGIDLAMFVRTMAPSMPILIVSGFSSELQQRLAKLKPPKNFLNKPYDIDDVIRIIGILGKR